MQTAILVDGAFFLRRYKYLYKNHPPRNAQQVARDLHAGVLRILRHTGKKSYDKEISLYRVFFYDCEPLSKKVHNPISNRCIDLGKLPDSVFRLALHKELKKLRKFALRLGFVSDSEGGWMINSKKTKDLLKGKIQVSDLTEDDVRYSYGQKCVDMKIGLDISSLAHKGQVKRIILISGDSDFVPAAKHARREGVDFILDTMGANIKDDLYEHIDGLYKSGWEPNIDNSISPSKLRNKKARNLSAKPPKRGNKSSKPAASSPVKSPKVTYRKSKEKALETSS